MSTALHDSWPPVPTTWELGYNEVAELTVTASDERTFALPIGAGELAETRHVNPISTHPHPRPVYDGASRTKRKCPNCGATVFRTVRDKFDPHGIEFALLVCRARDCGAIVAGGPIAKQ